MSRFAHIDQLVDEHGAVDVPLVGEDGNAFAIIGRVQRGLRRADWPADAMAAVRDEMMAGDYDHLLQVAITVTCGAEREPCSACGDDHADNACLYHDEPDNPDY